MRELSLDEPAALIYCPFRSLLHLPTWTDRRRVFERVAESLRPGGRFAWNAFVFHYAIAARLDGRHQEGRYLVRHGTAENRIDLTLDSGSSISIWWATKNEWLGLIDVAGWRSKRSTAGSTSGRSTTTVRMDSAEAHVDRCRHDAIAQLYDLEPQRHRRRAVLRGRGAKAGGPIVELGVGTGRIAVPTAAAGVNVIGVVVLGDARGLPRRRAEAAGISDLLDLRQGDLRRRPSGRVSRDLPLPRLPAICLTRRADRGPRRRT